MEEILECVKCGIHYFLTDNSTPTKCNICIHGISVDFGHTGITLIRIGGKLE